MDRVTQIPDKKMQTIQLKAACAAIGYKSYYWSTDKLLKTMGWLSIEKTNNFHNSKIGSPDFASIYTRSTIP